MAEGRTDDQGRGQLIAPAFSGIDGDYVGLIGCQGRDFPIRVSMSDAESGGLAATLTTEAEVNGSKLASPWNRDVVDMQMSSRRYGAVGLLDLSETRGGPRGVGVSALFADSADGAILSADRCEHGFIVPARGVDIVDRAIAELRAIGDQPAITTEDQARPCPANLERWIEAGLALPLDDWGRGDSDGLWRDELVRAVFGKSLVELTADERQAARLSLTASCGVRGDRKRGSVIRLLMAITDFREFRAAQYAAVERPIAQYWLAAMKPVVDNPSGIDPLAFAQARTAPRRFRIAELLARSGESAAAFDMAAFDADLDAAMAVAAASQAEDLFFAEMTAAAKDFRQLSAYLERALSDAGIDDERATGVFNDSAKEAAKSFAAGANTLSEASFMGEWIAAYRSGVACAGAQTAACRAVEKTFDDRLSDLAADFAAAASERVATASAHADDLPGLADLVRETAALEDAYRGLFGYPALSRAQNAWTRQRREVQRRLGERIVAALDAAVTAPEISEIAGLYFGEGDLGEPGSRRVAALIDKKLSATTPFIRTGADDYLNAIYNEDFAALRRLDRQAMSGLAPAYSFMAGQIEAMAQLTDALAGRELNVLMPAARELREPSAIKAVAIKYLLNFEDSYAKCLGDDAITFRFTERVDTVTTDRYGVELSRIEGVTTNEFYKVKKDLAPLFRATFARSADEGIGRALDRIFNDDGVVRLTDGVRTMMKEVDCASPEIARFEQGLNAYHAERTKYWSAPD
ncbi:MAG: hypothetical protein GC152_09090 [Alphaproteobacteria bacterium]|nr:hypothetical protein [Alphaproteobacteria bacterium]